MNNEELKQRTVKAIEDLHISPAVYSRLKKDDPLNIFPISTTYVYNICLGNFDDCGKHGIAAMKDYFFNTSGNYLLELDIAQMECLLGTLRILEKETSDSELQQSDTMTRLKQDIKTLLT